MASHILCFSSKNMIGSITSQEHLKSSYQFEKLVNLGRTSLSLFLQRSQSANRGVILLHSHLCQTLDVLSLANPVSVLSQARKVASFYRESKLKALSLKTYSACVTFCGEFLKAMHIAHNIASYLFPRLNYILPSSITFFTHGFEATKYGLKCVRSSVKWYKEPEGSTLSLYRIFKRTQAFLSLSLEVLAFSQTLAVSPLVVPTLAFSGACVDVILEGFTRSSQSPL